VLTHSWSFSGRCASLGAHTEGFQWTSDASDDDVADDADDVDHDDASSSPTSGASPNDAAQSACANTAQLCEVCLNAPRSGVALVPCGHSRFSGTCAETVAAMDRRVAIPVSQISQSINKKPVTWT